MAKPKAVSAQKAESDRLIALALGKKGDDEPQGPTVEEIVVKAGVDQAAAPIEPAPAEPRTNWKDKYIALNEEHVKLLAAQQTLNTAHNELNQAHSSLQGKYNAEVPQLSAQVRDLTASVEALNAKPTPQPAAPAEPQPNAALDTILSELREQFDPDLVDGIARALKAIQPEAPAAGVDIDSIVSTLEQKILGRVENVERVMMETNYDKLQKVIIAAVPTAPSYQVIDQDPAFIKYLQQRDIRSGEEYNVLLQTNWGRGNVEVAAGFYIEYLNKVMPTNGAGSDPSDLSLITGGQAPPAITNKAVNEDPIFLRSEVQLFEQAVRQGRYKKEPETITAMRKAFRLAAADGRVHPG